MNVFLAMTAVTLLSTQPVDGTLLFLEHGNPVVEIVTKKQITHVGIVFVDSGTAWLYEAVPGKVRRVPLSAYYLELSEYNRGRKQPAKIVLRHPRVAFSGDQTRAMKSFLDQQVDRRYSVKNYVVGTPGDGIHCAELTASALNRARIFDFKDCHAITPGELEEQVSGRYGVAIPVALSPAPTKSWCERSKQWWSGWFQWCGWSCGEAWSFCRR